MTRLFLAEIAAALAPRGFFEPLRPLPGGRRNRALLVRGDDGGLQVAKTTRRSEAALTWAAELQQVALRAGIAVAACLRAPDGRLAPRDVTLERFVEGAPATDLSALRLALARLRRLTESWPQRAGFASAAALLSRDAGGDVDFSLLPPALTAACREA